MLNALGQALIYVVPFLLVLTVIVMGALTLATLI